MRRYIAYFTLTLTTFLIGSASVLIWQSKRAFFEFSQTQIDSEIERRVIDARWVYIHRDIKWRPRPLPPPEIISDWKELNPEWDVSQWKELDASDRVVVFYPSGDYAEVLVALWRRDENHPIDFAPNGESSYHTYRGKWESNPDGSISTVASYSHMGVYDIPLRDTPNVYRRKWFVRQPSDDRLGTLLETEGEIFVPASELEDLDKLPYLIRDSAQASQRP